MRISCHGNVGKRRWSVASEIWGLSDELRSVKTFFWSKKVYRARNVGLQERLPSVAHFHVVHQIIPRETSRQRVSARSAVQHLARVPRSGRTCQPMFSTEKIGLSISSVLNVFLSLALGM